MTHQSLCFRLTVLIMTSLLVVWSIMAALSYRESIEEISELFDSRLEQSVHSILTLDLKRLQYLIDDKNKMLDDNDGDDDLHTKAPPFQVWNNKGQLLLRSIDAPPSSYIIRNGFNTVIIQGKRWRTFALQNYSHDFQVRMFENQERRQYLINVIMYKILMPLLLALPGLALLIWFSIRHALKPLQLLSTTIATRHSEKLDLIVVEHVPQEVHIIIIALNDLLVRLSKSIEQERRFTADASHELRTPLAAIKIQAEVALAAQDKYQQDQALRGIIEGVNRTARLSEQLLLLARLDYQDSALQSNIPLVELVRQSISRYVEKALDKDIDLSLYALEELYVVGNSMLLEVLVGNLIDNAIRYIPSKSCIEISIQKTHEQIVLSVKDNGFGLSDEDKKRVLNRFYRAEGTKESGSGLGLSIVECIAKAHHANLQLEKGLNGKGLGVTVQFKLS